MSAATLKTWPIPEGTCAEAGAIAAMIAAGDTRIAEICVIADSPELVLPCGGCRQKDRRIRRTRGGCYPAPPTANPNR